MIWGNPLAWLGALLVALPIVIHLFGRREPRIQPFPTLAFLDETRIPPARRSRIDDRVLLAVRAAVVLAATGALAQPLLLTVERNRARDEQLARAVVIDTSASMQRTVAADPTMTGVARAQQLANDLPDAADRMSIVFAADVRAAVQGAIAWLDAQPGRRELVVVSDFQVSSIDAADLGDIPPEIGLRLKRVGPMANEDVRVPGLRRIALADTGTTVEWAHGNMAATDWPMILAATSQQPLVEASRSAARALVANAAVRTRPIAIVHPSHPAFARIGDSLRPANEPWMPGVLERLRADELLRSGANLIDSGAVVPPRRGVVPILRADDGRTVAAAGTATVNGVASLVILTSEPPGSIVAARLVAAVSRAVAAPQSLAELESVSVADSVLARVARAPAPAPGRPHDSDGRWLWLLALVLLGIESWMRNR